MANNGKQAAKRPSVEVENPAPLYVGQWIKAMRLKPRDVVKGTSINEGYLSQIISGKKVNPSREKLAAIAQFIGVTISDFNRPPPDQALLDRIADYDPVVLRKLAEKRRS